MSKKSIIAAGFVVLIALIFGAVLIANFSGVKLVYSDSQIEFNTTPPLKVSPEVKRFNDAFVDICKAVTPTVVSITVKTDRKNEKKNDDQYKFFFGPDFQMPDQGPEIGSGSGVIVSKDGYIITNNHVVKEAGENGILVTLLDKREFKAKVIGTDANTDLAVIKIEANDLPTMSFGNSDQVQVGQWVLAIGNPLGLNYTVTAGIVSAMGRNIGINGGGYGIEVFIQTDAAINPGNSGGALVDINGQLVGINSAIKSNNGFYQGYGFAIPVNLVKSVISELIKNGKVSRGYIGVQIQQIDETMAKALGLDKSKGVLIQSVQKGGAGEDAGLKDGDVILSVEGKEVNAPNELQVIIGSHHPGETVKLVVFRDGKTIDKEVTLKPKSDDAQTTGMNNKKEEETGKGETTTGREVSSIGVSVAVIPSDLKDKLKVSNGVVVTNIDNYSDAFLRGIRKGMVIVEANKKQINGVDDLVDAVKGKSKGDSVLLKVIAQDGQERIMAVELQ
jgi:serine protease Do